MKCDSSTPNATPVKNKQLSLFDAGDAPATLQRLLPPYAPGHAGTVPIEKPPTLPPGARWREVDTQHQTIGFVLRRSRRKSIGLVINDDGLQVTAPHWVTLARIDAAVQDKAGWIVNKLVLYHQRQQHLAMQDTYWTDGAKIPYLGKHIQLALGYAGKSHHFTGSQFAPGDAEQLHLALPRSADHMRVRDSVHTWLQSAAAELFEQRLQHFLSISGSSINRWRLSSASTRWGSCSSNGNIMLNWRLIHFDHDIIDYVIAHEVAHLRHMNHSKDFWREVERLLPNFAASRDALRRYDPTSLPLI